MTKEFFIRYNCKYIFCILLLISHATIGQSSLPGQLSFSSIQKISDLEGNFEGNLDSEDHFGSDVMVLGDFDNDGIDDLLVGANNDDDGGSSRGAVYILLLNSDNSVKKKFKLSHLQGNLNGLQGGDNFGIAVESLGDLDRDGVIDIAVGAHYDGEIGYQQGAVWILFLKADGTIKKHQKISSIHGNLNRNLPDLASFGSSITSLGDLDQDGVVDIAVGAYRDNSNTTKSGALYILFLNTDGTVKNSQKIGEGLGGFYGGLSYEDYFGGQISPVGDLNNDGVLDIAVSAFMDDDGGSDRGAVYILFLNKNGTVKNESKISSISGNFSGSLRNGDFFGSALSAVGDMDGDNVLDIAVGADRDDDGGLNTGALWILYLNKDGNVKSHFKINNTSACLSRILDDGDAFGGSLCILKDSNKNKVKSIVSAAVLDDDGDSNKGSIYFLNIGTIVKPEAGENEFLCENKTFLSGNPPPVGIIGEWKVHSGTGIISNPNDPESEIKNLSFGENKITWNFVNNLCSPDASDSVVLTNWSFENHISFGGDDQVVCESSGFLSGNQLSGEYSGEWEVMSGSGIITNPSSPASQVINLSKGENKFIWRLTNEICNTSNTDTVIINYIDAESIPKKGEDMYVCKESASLVNGLPKETSGKWEVINGSAIISNPEDFESSVSNLSKGVNTFIFSPNVLTCEDLTYYLDIHYQPLNAESFPNIITPNKDSKNEFLEFENLLNYPDNRLLILNRWGRVLFEKQSYGNNWNGDNLDPGVYFIHLNVEDCYTYKGWLKILK